MENLISEFIREEQELGKKFRISFIGNLGNHTLTPRGLKAQFINKLVMLKGSVNYISKNQIRLKSSTHFCEKTQKFIFKNYEDEFKLRATEESVNKAQTNEVPLYDPQGNPLTLEFGLSIFNDFQTLGVQESPENIPSGLLSRTIDVYLQEDMIDSAKPGDRVQIIGIFKPLSTNSILNYGTFKTAFLAFSVTSLTYDQTHISFSPKELKLFKEISQKQNLIDLFTRSIAPSLYGHVFVKEAILLMLLGGNEVIKENGSKIKGDINVLLIGDPGTGKSQFLRRINHLSPLCVNSTGKGSTGVGLTAAIIQDKETNEKRLEGGAMVLADRGVICIDEFDKMSAEDRISMHEVMEQQTVTIAKSGIHCSLSARCSILAAANPTYGEYITNKSPSFNIGIQESILSRFDLIFIVLDENEEKEDRNIALKVTQNHRYSDNFQTAFNKVTGGIVERELIEEKEKEILEAYEQYNAFLHENANLEFLNQPFIKKYISFAKENFKPELGEEMVQYVTESWCYLRQYEWKNQKVTKLLDIGIRNFEGLIRLSTAYAKLRLSKKVELVDGINAVKLVMKAFYGGYQEIDKDFFMKYQNLLNIGREKILLKTTKKLRENVKQQKRQKENKNEKNQEESVRNKKRSKLEPEIIVPEVVETNIQKIEEKKKKKKDPFIGILKKYLFSLLYQIDQGEISQISKNKKHVKDIWNYIQTNLPSPQHPKVNFVNLQIFHKILNILEKESKIVIEREIIYLM